MKPKSTIITKFENIIHRNRGERSGKKNAGPVFTLFDNMENCNMQAIQEEERHVTVEFQRLFPIPCVTSTATELELKTDKVPPIKKTQ